MLRQQRPFPIPGYRDAIEFQKLLQKVRLPRTVRDRIVVAVKRRAAPGEAARRRKAVSAIGASPFLDGVDFERFAREGAVLLPQGTVGSALPAAEALDRMFERMRESGEARKDESARKGQFLISVADENELLAVPEVRDFVLGEEIVGLATRYFGEVPVLSGVSLMWSPPNELCVESQLYHYDGEDRTHLKVLLIVKDVDQACGPFTFVPAETGEKLPHGRRQSARLDDASVESAVGEGAVRKVVGPKGTVAAVDTSRCLHYGSRGNSQDRLMLFVQFNRFLAPKARATRLSINDELIGSDERLATLRNMVMSLA